MSEHFITVNPYDNKEIETYPILSEQQLGDKLDLAGMAFKDWKMTEMQERIKLIKKVSALLIDNRDAYARTMTREMGKPISESRAEIEKCKWVCDYYAEHAALFLQDEHIETDARESYVRFDPLGTIFGIMPWNYPFWQVFRFAIPTVMAGNTALLKHAVNVLGSAQHIEDIFTSAGYPNGVFQSLVITHDQAERVIGHAVVKAVSLTGSERAGSTVAATAAKHLKKSVLELGGSNAFVVFQDADLKSAIRTGVKARFQNTGQSCIAAKRFILVDEIYDTFLEGFLDRVKGLNAGDPMDKNTQVGPLARKDLADKVYDQVSKSVEMGAEILMGGQQEGAAYSPTVLVNVKPGMPAFEEEVFGPVAVVIRAENEEHAMELANNSSFGLGLTLFTTDKEKANKYAALVGDGAYFVNEMVKSDPRLPFGGTRNSGFGRELSREGIMEFVNKKTVYMK